MEKNHRRRYEGKEDGIKSPAAALLGGGGHKRSGIEC